MIRLGVYYRQIIEGREDLEEIELPFTEQPVELEPTLFSWKAKSGKRVIECRSEEMARYIKVFWEAMALRIEVPADDEYIREILPRLEKIKQKHDQIIYDHIEWLSTARAKKEYLQLTWSKLLYEEAAT